MSTPIVRTPLTASHRDELNAWRAQDASGQVILLGSEESIRAIVETVNRAAELGTLLERMHLQQLKRAIDVKDYIDERTPVTLVLNGYVVTELREAIAQIIGES
jgi:hypothetical protein